MKKVLFCLMVVLCGQLANATPVKAGDIVVDAAWARSTAPQAQNGAAYLIIENQGKTTDRLLSAEATVDSKTQIHRTTMENGTMRMREVEGGLELRPGSTTKFAPGGLHVMLLGLKAPLKAGQQFPLTLRFAKAGEIRVDVRIDDTPASSDMHDMHKDMHQ